MKCVQTSDGSQEQVGPEGKEEQRASESDEGPVDGQAEITTPVPAKEPKLAPVSDGSPEVMTLLHKSVFLQPFSCKRATR